MVRVSRQNIGKLFISGQIDIVMSGLVITPARARQWDFATPTMDLTLGLLVPDHDRKKFVNFSHFQARDDLTLGIVLSDPAFSRWVQSGLPLAKLVDVSSPRGFLRGDKPELDAVIYSAEGGSAWTLIYPDFSIVVPADLKVKVPAGYPLPKGDLEWTRFVSTWVDMTIKNGKVDRLFTHWISGGGAKPKEPRWSVIRNVLHWVD